MTPTDTLPSNSDRAATQAVDSVRLPTGRRYPNNLPLELNRFIGRERELGELKPLLWSTRLLTLTGPGGCGKTRLALRLAFSLLDAFADGVWLVELAALSDPALVAQTVATALNLREQAGRSIVQALIDYFEPREVLLVLDNCEHLILACAQLAEGLRRACPNLHILATSREALNIAGEIAWLVPPLSLPDSKASNLADTLQRSEAVQLFIDRAASVQPSWTATEQDVTAVAQTCQQLDGLPLAIELAAARVKALSVQEISARLEDRFRLLTHNIRTAMPRHQTLQAAIDWSYSLLSAEEKVLFQRLAVFAGGWTLEAAEAVCGDEGLDFQIILEALTRLVDKSLIQIKEHRAETRYQFLKTIRRYASSKLLESGELDKIQRQHFTYFLQFAETGEPAPRTDEEQPWRERLEGDLDNLRSALTYSLSHDVESGLRLATVFSVFCRYKYYYADEVVAWLRAFLVQPAAASRTLARAKALFHAGLFLQIQPENYALFQQGRVWLEESLAIYRELDEQAEVADALFMLGNFAVLNADLDLAQALYAESAQVSRALGDRRRAALVLKELGVIYKLKGDRQQARQQYQESLQIFQELGMRYAQGTPLIYLGDLSWLESDLTQAWSFYADGLACYQAAGREYNAHWIYFNLSQVAVRLGNYEEAWIYIEKGLAISQEVGWNYLIGVGWSRLAFLAHAQGDYERANELYRSSLSLLRNYMADDGTIVLERVAGTCRMLERTERATQLLGAAAAYRERMGMPLPPIYLADVERDLTLLKASMSQEAFALTLAAGRAMSIEQAIAFALADVELHAPMEQPSLSPIVSPDPKEEFGGLTAREREIAVLVAQGKSNRDIAAALVLSERTVASHVSNILSKLEFDSRTQIAVWALEKGLTKLPT